MELIEQRNARLIDIRDSHSYEVGHILNAELVNGDYVGEFVEEADLEQPLIVYCYHGNMSQGAAAYFTERGFTEAYSLDGGYTDWTNG